MCCVVELGCSELSELRGRERGQKAANLSGGGSSTLSGSRRRPRGLALAGHARPVR